MALADPAFASSPIFDQLSSFLSASPANQKSAVSSTKALFTFTVRNSQGATASWYVDFKETGTVGKGAAPEGKKADVNLILSDADLGKLIEGKANAQKLFMGGKLKVKGDVMKAGKVEVWLKKAQQEGGQPKPKL